MRLKSVHSANNGILPGSAALNLSRSNTTMPSASDVAVLPSKAAEHTPASALCAVPARKGWHAGRNRSRSGLNVVELARNAADIFTPERVGRNKRGLVFCLKLLG